MLEPTTDTGGEGTVGEQDDAEPVETETEEAPPTLEDTVDDSPPLSAKP